MLEYFKRTQCFETCKTSRSIFPLDIRTKKKNPYCITQCRQLSYWNTYMKRGNTLQLSFLILLYRKLRMSNFQNLASPNNDFYYVKGKRRFRANKNEQGNRSPLDISKQVQLSKHELSNMRRSQVWTKIL
jgi:hypothetical protein